MNRSGFPTCLGTRCQECAGSPVSLLVEPPAPDLCCAAPAASAAGGVPGRTARRARQGNRPSAPPRGPRNARPGRAPLESLRWAPSEGSPGVHSPDLRPRGYTRCAPRPLLPFLAAPAVPVRAERRPACACDRRPAPIAGEGPREFRGRNRRAHPGPRAATAANGPPGYGWTAGRIVAPGRTNAVFRAPSRPCDASGPPDPAARSTNPL